MFEFLQPEPWYRRWGRGLFLVLTPLVFVLFTLRGRESEIYVSFDPFWISNYQPSRLPTFFAELFAYGYYEGTAAALLLAATSTVACRRSRRNRKWVGPGVVWYLPAFVAGAEGMRHLLLLGSRHGFTEAPGIDQLRRESLTAAFASISLVLFCLVLGAVFARLARDSSKVPFAAVPVVLSVAVAWCGILRILLWGPGCDSSE